MNYRKNLSNKKQEIQKDFVSEFNSDWIKKGFDNKTLDFCDEFGKYLADGMTTSQIRNYFGEVKRIQMSGIQKEKNAFYMLKPKLAYLSKRADKDQTLKFKKIMDKAHEAVLSDENNFEQAFKNYVDFLEAILAFHKSHGGKTN